MVGVVPAYMPPPLLCAYALITCIVLTAAMIKLKHCFANNGKRANKVKKKDFFVYPTLEKV